MDTLATIGPDAAFDTSGRKLYGRLRLDRDGGMWSVEEIALDRRAAAPVATITAGYFGDPPPGRSALDQRRALA
jgi:hypothetical protein